RRPRSTLLPYTTLFRSRVRARPEAPEVGRAPSAPSVLLRADGILEGVAEQHRYQLQNDAANRLIGALLDAASVPADRRVWFQQLDRKSTRLNSSHRTIS